MRTGNPRVAGRAARRQRAWPWRTMPALTIVLVAIGNVSAGSPPLPRTSRADQQLTPTEIGALHAGAIAHPYATLTLLYVLRDSRPLQHGSLYLESVPEAALTSLLLGSADSDAVSILLGELLWSPYSASRFLVQVTWSARAVASGGKAIEFHTQLLSPGGLFPHPPLEPDTTVLLTNGDVRFLAPALFM